MQNSIPLSVLAVSVVLSAPAIAQTPTLVGHWAFSETSGVIVHDSSGNTLDATLQGGVTLGHPGAHPTTGTAALFDSSQLGLGVIPDQAPLSSLLEDLTVAAWVRTGPGGPSSYPERVFGGDGSAWSCGLRASGPRFTTSGIRDYDLAATFPIDQWFHLAFVFDDVYDVTVYIDGAPAGTVVGYSPAGAVSGQWLIGSFRSGGITNEGWDGYLDDIQVYSGSLTASDIDFLFQNPGATLGGWGGTPYCFGDGSGTPCPCGNDNDGSVPESGCANGIFASGARLISSGVPSLSGDTLILATSGLEPSNSGLYFQANNDLSPGILWGDGLQCAGGQLKRLGVRFSDATGYSDTSGYPQPISVKAGNILAGDTKYYQCWYRNPNGSPCASDFNASNGYAVTWIP